MKYFIAIVLTFSASAFSATVGDFPFDALDEGNETEISTEQSSLETSSTENQAVEDEFINETTELSVEPLSDKSPPAVMKAPTPLFKIFRDFLFQARDGLLDPSIAITEGPIDEKTEKVFKLLEHGLIEATTILVKEMENTFSTPPSIAIDNSFAQRRGDSSTKVQREMAVASKNKRQMAEDIVSNMSASCSSCYNKLQTCVQQCFVEHNCNDVQRNARSCPPSPNRLCNLFTPWSPVDECKSNEECKSPLICCNDGCINKCVPGVWSS